MQSFIGMKLGAYQIIEQIGQGGMATVYKAYQASMDRYVAVKILPQHLSEDKTFVGRFDQEARILARLEHPHILPVHDFGEQDGITYLVMRYVGAGTLKDVIAREGPLPLKEVARIVDQVGRALDYAHSQGVLHRDIKPSNILIDSGRDSFLTDFGIAKLVAETAQLTGSGAIIGTPAYMAPEQCLGEPVDGRCDVYALGVLLYEVVTGRVPYEAETPLAVVLKQIHEPPPIPRQVRPDLPAAVERVVLKAMAKDPAERWQTPREMVEALNRAVADRPTGAMAVETAAPAGPELLPAERAEAAASRPGGEAGTGGGAPAGPGAGGGPAAPPAAQRAAARRWPRWLPFAAAGAVLLAAMIVAAVVFSGGRRGGSGSQLGPAQAGWTSYSNGNLAVAVARQEDWLWVGSDGGLVRWSLDDGSYVKLGAAGGLASGRVNDLLVDGQGTLWAATAAGLCRLDGETWTTFDEPDGLDSDWVEVVWEDDAGGMWAGTGGGARGLNYLDGASWSVPPVPAMPVEEPTITALAGSGPADLYVGTADSGLAHYDGQAWTVLGSGDGLPGDKILSLASTEDSLWAGFDDALVRFDRGTGEWDKVRDTTVYAIHAASDGGVWFGTSDGPVRLDPDTGDWQPFTKSTGLFPSGRVVTDVFTDERGAWLATYGDGALLYADGEWKSWMTPDRLGGNQIVAIRQGLDGALWFTHLGTGLSRYQPDVDAWKAFGEADGALDWPSAPGVDSQGGVWIARDGVLLSYDGRGWQAREVPELENVGVEAVDIGPDDVQWLRTDAGLVRHDPADGTWSRFDGGDHPVLAGARALLISRSGSVWVGGPEGLARYDGGTWTAGEAASAALRDVTDMAEAADGSLWVAARGELAHVDQGQGYVYRRPDEGYVYSLAIGPDGEVWVAGEGIARFDPAADLWDTLGTGDGLIDMRVNDILVTDEGVVWIGTEGGVSRYVPPPE